MSAWRSWKMVGAFLALALLGGILSAARAPSAAASTPKDRGTVQAIPEGPISHVGRWLTDAAGRVVLLHGVNMVEKQAPYYPSAYGFSDADAAWLEDNGLDVVRLGVLGTGLMPTPGQVDETYLDRLATTVHDLGSHHVYVLLDLHQDGFSPTVGSDGFPQWMTVTNGAVNNHLGFPAYYIGDPATQEAFQSLWNNEPGANGVPLQTDVAQMVHALAQRFAHTPNVLGYDIYNEPWPGNVWVPCIESGGCPALERSELDPFYARIDQALRSVDQRQLLFVEPFVTFNFGTTPTTITLPGADQNSGLSFHQYATTTSAAAGVLSQAVAWSQRTGGALLDTEWGATMSASAITTQAQQFDNALMPWIFWSFDEWVVHDIGLPPSGSNLVQSTVSALVRPYPEVVAGTPSAISYNPSTKAFSAQWSTTEPDGQVASAHAMSTIVVPPLDYPSGYTVTVSGATVISPPCALDLRLATATSTASVSVSITPGGSCPGR